jgi:hypothetical protein
MHGSLLSHSPLGFLLPWNFSALRDMQHGEAHGSIEGRGRERHFTGNLAISPKDGYLLPLQDCPAAAEARLKQHPYDEPSNEFHAHSFRFD